MLKSNERLVYADDGINEVVIRYNDISDFIVDYNDKFGQVNLTFYEYGIDTTRPIITTFGSFLNKCNPEIRMDIIDRLVYLQQGGKVKDYKVIDEDPLESVLQTLNLNKNI